MATTVGIERRESNVWALIATLAAGAVVVVLLISTVASWMLLTGGAWSDPDNRTAFEALSWVTEISNVVLGFVAVLCGVLSVRRGELARARAGIAIGIGLVALPGVFYLIAAWRG